MVLPHDLQNLLGHIDIYLLDQILRGNIQPGMRVMDVGCGGGRNLVYFMRTGFSVMGLDPDANAIAAVRNMAGQLAPHLPDDAFRVESGENSSFDDACADVVISNAVLHFSRDTEHFDAQLDGAWRLLAPGGLYFARLGSSIGLEDRYLQSSGSANFLVSLDDLLAHTQRLGAQLLDPIKTTNVQNLRCMTTWVLRKAT